MDKFPDTRRATTAQHYIDLLKQGDISDGNEDTGLDGYGDEEDGSGTAAPEEDSQNTGGQSSGRTPLTSEDV